MAEDNGSAAFAACLTPGGQAIPGRQEKAWEDRTMDHDSGIWDAIGSLMMVREAAAGEVISPPLPDQYQQSGPLRMILRDFLDAPDIWRDHMVLRLENGQTFNASDIVELLDRKDSPLKMRPARHLGQ